MKKFQKKIRVLVTVILTMMMAFVVSGCSYISQDEKGEVVNFYISFAEEATSLDPVKIRDAYTGLSEQNFEGQSSNAVRDRMFAKFNTINPELFSKIHYTDSSYTEVGKTYSSILLMSLATEGKSVDVTMPFDAVSVYNDEKLGKKVYEIDRSKITATVPEPLAPKLDRPNRIGLAPVKLIKDGESWKILADGNMLTEIGVPLSEKIAAPDTKDKK